VKAQGLRPRAQELPQVHALGLRQPLGLRPWAYLKAASTVSESSTRPTPLV
jgi:hypothetical protein